MLKKILPLTVLPFVCFLQFPVYAQDHHPWNIEAAGGIVFPMGKFANKTYDNSPGNANSAGLAKTGWSPNISVFYQVEKHLGVLFTTGMSFNKQDPTSYETWAVGSSPNNTAAAKTNSWKIFKAMGGAWLNLVPVENSKAALRASITLGVCKTTVPGYSFVESQNGSPFLIAMHAKQTLPLTFCYQLGLEFHYKINSWLYMLVESGLFEATAKRRYQYNPNFPNAGTLVSATQKYSLSNLDLSAGIGFGF